MEEILSLKCEVLYKLVYDFFSNGLISLEFQRNKIKCYEDKSMKEKAFIAKLVYYRISKEWDSYWDFYCESKRQYPIPKEYTEYIEQEIKRGFFTKDVYFDGQKLKEKL